MDMYMVKRKGIFPATQPRISQTAELRNGQSYSRSREFVGGAAWEGAPLRCGDGALSRCAAAERSGCRGAATKKGGRRGRDGRRGELRPAARSELPAAPPRFIAFTRFCFRRSNHVTGETSPFPRGWPLCSGQSETYI